LRIESKPLSILANEVGKESDRVTKEVLGGFAMPTLTIEYRDDHERLALEQALAYLGRYTHRVAISNHRLVSDQDGQVSFQWKDYRHDNEQKVMTVDADEFIRRFLIHTLPTGFQRIRHFGFLANCHRKAKLVLCRQLLVNPVTGLLPTPDQCRQMLAEITEKPVRLCPHCGIGSMIRIAILPSYHWPATPPPDTS